MRIAGAFEQENGMLIEELTKQRVLFKVLSPYLYLQKRLMITSALKVAMKIK